MIIYGLENAGIISASLIAAASCHEQDLQNSHPPGELPRYR